MPIQTDWPGYPGYRELDSSQLRDALGVPVGIEDRDVFDPKIMERLGFRSPASPDTLTKRNELMPARATI